MKQSVQQEPRKEEELRKMMKSQPQVLSSRGFSIQPRNKRRICSIEHLGLSFSHFGWF